MSYQVIYQMQQQIKALEERVAALEEKLRDVSLSAPDAVGDAMLLKRKPGRPRKEDVEPRAS